MLHGISLRNKEKIFQQLINKAALLIVILLVLFFLTLLWQALPAVWHNGWRFLTGAVWDAAAEQYGALPLLYGTLLTSLLALLLTLPFALALALFLGEFFPYGLLSSALRAAVELLAGIPSVVYGFWAVFALVPLIRRLEIALGVVPLGVGVLAAVLVLTIMIIPYAASVAAEVIQLAPQDIREAAYALGATRYEVLRRVVLPAAFSGIFAGVLLAFGRAFGETMAVTMVIGNSNKIPASLFDTGNTMASIIANELAEATSPLYVASLVEIGLLLFLVSAALNLAGKYIIRRFSREI
ncbi:MAG: phosphate ABC transporter permease subunit PstC [Candidatus Margulisbacteria bacterium]|jgi:phosphate transport system permease protein|nr:phosphate ABC transporter permease subunit PstC [Candidatus Margulisiibacteriota bacterium]